MKPTKTELSQRAEDKRLAKELGTTDRTIRNYRAAGAPLDDKGAMAKWLAARRSQSSGTASALKDFSSITDLGDAKIQKIILECERLQTNIDRERRKLVPIEEVRRDLIRIGSAERAEDMRLVGDVGTWEGLPAAEMSERAREWLDAKCKNLSDQLSRLYGSA